MPSELASATAALRATAERTFVVQVLEELEASLHAKFGRRAVIRIRRLALGCQLDANELAAHEVAAKLAHDLAEQIVQDLGALPQSERLRPRDERFALFEDDVHADAAYLADVADGRTDHWLHAGRTSAAQTWADAVARGPRELAELVRWLRRMERLEAAVAMADESSRDAIVDADPDAAGVVALVRAREQAARQHGAGHAREYGHAPSRSGPPLARRENAGERAPDPARSAPLPANEPANVEAVALPEATVAIADSRHAHGASTSAATPPRSSREGGAPAATPVAAAASADAEPGVTLDTDAAGLFYLVGRVLEIELAERLWAAGIAEGPVLAAVGNAVLGTSDAPAAHWFGGGFDRPLVLANIAGWAMTEVNEVVQHALGRRLVDFGVRVSPAELDASLEQLARDVPAPAHADGITRRLVARSVAALATIACARLGERASLARLRDVCLRPGRLVLTPDELYVVLPHHAIDVEIRRAGLDHDPGDAPWLQRRVRIEFAGTEVL